MRRRLAAHPGYQPDRSRRATRSAAARAPAASPSRRTCSAPTSTSAVDYSQQTLEKAQKLPSLADAKIGLNAASPEVQVAVDRARAADLGVRMATVGNTLRLMVAGDDEISTYREAASSTR